MAIGSKEATWRIPTGSKRMHYWNGLTADFRHGLRQSFE